MKAKLPRFSGLALVGALALAACVDSPRARVGVKNVPAELVFGIPTAEEPVAPPGAFPEAPKTIDLNDFDDEGAFQPSSRPPPPKPRCPKAGSSEFPEQAAPPTIEGKPKLGSYTWRVQGHQLVTGVPFPVKLNEFEQRRVQAITQPDVANPQNFSFSTIQKKPGTGSNTLVISTFIVDVTNPTPTLKGVLLDKIEEDKQDGSLKTLFDPEPDIMYLPVPVQQGSANTFETVGADPRSQQTLQHRGFVKERKDIDACGKMIQSWFVDGESFFRTGLAERRINFDYGIATHFGGLIVFEHVQSACEDSGTDGSCTPAPEIEYDTNIGQVEPS